MHQEVAGVIAFTRGNPAEEGLPLEDLRDCAAEIFRREGKVLFQYGHYSGYRPLREWLAARYGVSVERVLLGNSSMEFCTFLAAALVTPGDVVFVERPSYDRAITAFRRAGAEVRGIPLRPDGVDLEALEAELKHTKPRLFYLIPDFQNPSGATAGAVQRSAVAGLARRHGFLCIEDAPYRPLRYRGTELPTIWEQASEQVCHVSSFSKTLSPGLRVGYMILPASLAPRILKWSEDTYIHPVLPAEGIVFEYCRRGLLEPNIARLKSLYRPRLDAILAALQRHMKGAEWIAPEGGFFVSVSLPETVDGEGIRRDAAKFGLGLTDGRNFFPDARGENFVRLPFCALTPAELDEGIQRLARAVDAHHRG
jgi:DNA-binding transcriptional MocR family regulator